jgi:hypothetical protein
MQGAIQIAVCLCVAVALSACGGGSRRRPLPPPPPPPVLQPGTLQLTAASLNVAETAGTATLRITRTGGSDGAVSVTVVSTNGTASANDDYTAVNTTVTFADADAAEKTVTVPVADDVHPETDETLSVTISSPTGGATLGAITAATVTITDNDPPGPPVLTLAADIKQLRFATEYLDSRRSAPTTTQQPPARSSTLQSFGTTGRTRAIGSTRAMRTDARHPSSRTHLL